jgi:acetyl esterase/lipase
MQAVEWPARALRRGHALLARGATRLMWVVLGALVQAAWPVLAAAPSAGPVEVPLWPATAPGSEGLVLEQRVVERSSDPALPDRYADGIAAPSLTVYRPVRPDGRALLVIPGGGYQRVVLDKEGSALVPAFVDHAGLTLFVLQYRLPGEGHRDARDVPLADAQRALRLIRSRAAEWDIDPATLGVMGFSAGGHVAASLATRHAEKVYAAVDAADALDARPAYAVLVYPVIDMGAQAHPGSRQKLLGDAPAAEAIHAYSLQNRVDARTPPVFLLHAQDDAAVPVENSLLLEQALRAAGIEHETHLYAHGGHGFGVREARGTLALWPQLAIAWIRAHAPVADANDTSTRPTQD